MAQTIAPGDQRAALELLAALGHDHLERFHPVVRGTLLGLGLVRWSVFHQRFTLTDAGRAELAAHRVPA